MLTQLPVLVVDRILAIYVSNNDLRVIHQVCNGWRNLIETRTSVNARRLALVTTIREQKENIIQSTQPLVLPTPEPKNTNEHTKENVEEKTGSGRTLRNLSNHLLVTPAPNPSSQPSKSTTGGRRRISRISSTPKSRYQKRYEAGLKLMPGQVLFSCPGCNSPVPSPISSAYLITKETSVSVESDSGISVTSLDAELSKIRDVNYTPSIFDSPSDIETSINISIIATPPSTPPIFHVDVPHDQSTEQTTTPCPCLMPSSTLSMVEGDSLVAGTDTSTSVCMISKSNEQCDSPGQHLEIVMNPENSIDSTPPSEPPDPAMSLLRSLQEKHLKIKSCPTPPLLVMEGKTEVLGSSDPSSPVVIQCPDCFLRFCSQCQFREHTGKSCRILAVDEMYNDDDSLEHSHPPLAPPPLATRPPSTKPRARSATTSTTGGKSNKKKGSLRRLAYL